jgi:CRISPR-associated protein Cmr2
MSFFEKKLAALLHDPSNKAWNIKTHRATAKQIARDILSDKIPKISELLDDEDVKDADRIASSIDRWILTKAMGGKYERGKWPTSTVSLYNPFSTKGAFKIEFEGPIDIKGFTENMVHVLDIHDIQSNLRYLYHLFYSTYEYEWLRERPNSPADTRIPIHTIFDHNYATATALNLVKGKEVRGWLVHIDIGNIQNFITASKKLAHFWASSWLVSALSWHLVSPFVMEFGPDVLILPTARSNPFYYAELIAQMNVTYDGKVPPKLIETAEKLSGYESAAGFPRNAVMPATVTLVLPSKQLYSSEIQEFEHKYSEIGDADQIIAFISSRFTGAWNYIATKVAEALGKETKKFFDDIGASDVPPLVLRVAVSEIEGKIDGQDLSGIYDKAVKNIASQHENLRKVKASPYIRLNLTSFTRDRNFRICTICGQLAGIEKKTLNSNLVNDLDDTDRLCPYCLVKHTVVKENVFRSVLSHLLAITGRNTAPPRFPSLAAVSTLPFREKYADMAIKDPSSFIPQVSIENIRGNTLYAAEDKLIKKFENIPMIHAFLLKEPEEVVYSKENRKFLTGKAGFSPNTYYALLKADGDDMGKVIRGQLYGKDRQTTNAETDGDDMGVEAFKTNGFNASKHFTQLTPNPELARVIHGMELDDSIPASITFHATISRALMTFSLKAVEVVGRNKGFVLYAGGDEIICVLPAEIALKTALEIRREYRGDNGFDGFYTLGDRPAILSLGELGQTLSLVYSHYKYPLSYAISKLNIEEENAKNKKWDSVQKNNIAITYLARGSHDIATYLPLERKELLLGYACKEIDSLLQEIVNGTYSVSVIKDLLDWRERIDATDQDTANKLIEYVLSRNILSGSNKSDYKQMAHRISQLIKISPESKDGKSMIEEFFTALKCSHSAMREIK